MLSIGPGFDTSYASFFFFFFFPFFSFRFSALFVFFEDVGDRCRLHGIRVARWGVCGWDQGSRNLHAADEVSFWE